MKMAEHVNDWNFSEWEFTGRNIEVRDRGEWSEDNQDGISVDDYYPMMNYAYPLDNGCPSESTIKEIHKKASLTVVCKLSTDTYYLSLTGGGMNLSQDIAMAYIIAENRVPTGLAREVNVETPLTQHGDNYRKVLNKCKQSLENIEYQINKIDKALKEV